jgi:ACR3 family arsenite efflux pump ArsB
MMYPILCKVKYESLHLVFQKREIWIQIIFSIVVNWLIAPFLMVCQDCYTSTSYLELTARADGSIMGLLTRQIWSS